MDITIQEIQNREEWNNFLIHQPLVHFLQSYEWGELNEFINGRMYRLGALREGRLVGVMALTVIPLPIPRMQYNWLYSARGPIVENNDPLILAKLINAAHDIARRERSVVLRLEPNIADDDPDMDAYLAQYHKLQFHSNPISFCGRRSWVLDIRPSAEQLLANFKMTWRQNVRVAERKGVIVREATSEADFDAYYELLKITSERDAFFIHDKDYHREILRRYSEGNNIVLYLAEHEGDVLAARVLLRFGDWCWDLFGASSNIKRNLKATYLLHFHCFQWAQAQGCSYFDFRLIPEILEPGQDMWGVYEYKKGFGGYSRMNMPTQDYVYRPLIYKAWGKLVEMRRARRAEERKKVELERAARGKTQLKEQQQEKEHAQVAR